MKNIWNKNSSTYRIQEVSEQVKNLPSNVFAVGTDILGFYLTNIKEAFEFPYKIYGIETDFIKRVCKTYDNTSGNLGVLLNGIKGTGKTVTAEIICNRLNLPVILLTEYDNGIIPFLNSIQQDVVLFIDEFDKIFNGWDKSILTLMDGVLNSSNRRVFMLTTNELHFDSNLLQRPSRIRYVKSFDNLDIEIVEEIIDDMLIHWEWKDAIISTLSELRLITIDLVKSIISEVNIHNDDPKLFIDIFNVYNPHNDRLFDIYIKYENKEYLIFENSIMNRLLPFKDNDIGDVLYVNGNNIGTIMDIISGDIAKILLQDQNLISTLTGVPLDKPVSIDESTLTNESIICAAVPPDMNTGLPVIIRCVKSIYTNFNFKQY